MKYIKRINEFTETESVLDVRAIEDEINLLALRLTDEGYEVECRISNKDILIYITYDTDSYTLSRDVVSQFRSEVNDFYHITSSYLKDWRFNRRTKSFAPPELSEGVDFVVYVTGSNKNVDRNEKDKTNSLAVDLNFSYIDSNRIRLT